MLIGNLHVLKHCGDKVIKDCRNIFNELASNGEALFSLHIQEFVSKFAKLFNELFDIHSHVNLRKNFNAMEDILANLKFWVEMLSINVEFSYLFDRDVVALIDELLQIYNEDGSEVN